MKKSKKIDCAQCHNQSACCRFGAWVDLEDAKKIAVLGLKGEFFHLEKDNDFPSGFRVGTSIGENPCTFLTPEGLCAIHKIDYWLKPRYCREFPYEDGELSEFAPELCLLAKKAA